MVLAWGGQYSAEPFGDGESSRWKRKWIALFVTGGYHRPVVEPGIRCSLLTGPIAM